MSEGTAIHHILLTLNCCDSVRRHCNTRTSYSPDTNLHSKWQKHIEKLRHSTASMKTVFKFALQNLCMGSRGVKGLWMEHTNQMLFALGWSQPTGYTVLYHHITGTLLAMTYADHQHFRQHTAPRLLPAFGHDNRPKSFTWIAQSTQTYLQPSLGGGFIVLQRLTDSLMQKRQPVHIRDVLCLFALKPKDPATVYTILVTVILMQKWKTYMPDY